MKQITLMLCCALTALALVGQELQPQWVESKGRAMYFPADTYFTGFAVGNVRAGETQASAIARVKKDAQGYLSESIRVKVESETQSQTHQYGDDYVSSLFTAATKTAANAEIAGAKLDSYVDKANNAVYAFAYASRAELAKYYQSQISLWLGKVEGALRTASQLEAGKKKVSSRKECEKAIPLLAKVVYAQDLLTAVGSSEAEGLQQDRSEELRNDVVQLLERLKQGTLLYVTCNENTLDVNRGRLREMVEDMLSENGCSLTEEPLEADFQLNIRATANECKTNEHGQAFAYMDVTAELVNSNNKVIAKGKFTDVKGGSNTCDKAMREAIKEVVPMIWGKIEGGIKEEGK